MNPSVQDRLGSTVRALGNVILPALPDHASLAREQAMLVMGHLQIIAAQLDATPAFEAEEAADLQAMAEAVIGEASGGDRTRAAVDALAAVVSTKHETPARIRTRDLQDAIDDVLVSMADDGDPASVGRARAIVLARGLARAQKDRRWFSAMGFDAEFAPG